MPDLPELRDRLLARPLEPRLPRRTEREVASVRHRTVVRTAAVQAEGMVQAEKVREVQHLTREAMTDHAMLRKFADVIAAGDIFAADDNRFFLDIAKLGCGEIIADTIAAFSREGRS
jgi:hypothetical protein